MNREERNIDIVERIIKYCGLIQAATERFGSSLEAFKGDMDYRSVCAMYILQIGELSTHLSDSFRETYADIPWREIRGIRNVFAHDYDRASAEKLWETITHDIPSLHDACAAIITQNAVLNQDAITPELDDEDEMEW